MEQNLRQKICDKEHLNPTVYICLPKDPISWCFSTGICNEKLNVKFSRRIEGVEADQLSDCGGIPV